MLIILNWHIGTSILSQKAQFSVHYITEKFAQLNTSLKQLLLCLQYQTAAVLTAVIANQPHALL